MSEFFALIAVLLLGACSFIHPQVPNTAHTEGMASVVIIESPRGHGSGVLVKREKGGLGTFLTNAHVCSMFRSHDTNIRFSDDDTYEVMRIVSTNTVDDICKFTSMIEDQKPIRIAAYAPILGAPVCALGNPLSFEFVLTCGNKIGFIKRGEYERMLTNALVYRGSSGGPVLNAQGHLVGLTQSGAVIPIMGHIIPLGYHYMVTLKAIK